MGDRVDVHPELEELREQLLLEDDAGRPFVLHVDAPLRPASQRLMDSLGVTVEVRTVSVTAGQLALQRGTAAFDYRASRARTARRVEAGETPQVCSGCGTEVDVDAASHAPSCRYFDVAPPTEVKTEGIHTAAGSLTAKEMQRRHQEHLDQRPTTTGCAHEGCGFHFEGTLVECREKFEAHRREKHPGVKSSRGVADREIERGRAEAAHRAQQRALRALDDGEPQSALEDSASDLEASDEVEEPEDRPAEADADTTTTSVGDQDAEGADGAHDTAGRVGGTSTRTRRPIPQQTRDVACSDCRLCMNADGLLARGYSIGFEIHGTAFTVRQARRALAAPSDDRRRLTLRTLIPEYLADHPDARDGQIARDLGYTAASVTEMRQKLEREAAAA